MIYAYHFNGMYLLSTSNTLVVPEGTTYFAIHDEVDLAKFISNTTFIVATLEDWTMLEREYPTVYAELVRIAHSVNSGTWLDRLALRVASKLPEHEYLMIYYGMVYQIYPARLVRGDEHRRPYSRLTYLYYVYRYVRHGRQLEA